MNHSIKGHIMTLSIKDINNIETDDSVDEVEYYTSIQRAINSGMWSIKSCSVLLSLLMVFSPCFMLSPVV